MLPNNRANSLANSLANNRVHVFGIRHHGPGSARSLCHALEALAPDCLLVEGPPDAQEMLPWVTHAALQPPVALLIYVPDSPRRAVYYPFATFSPEWQALRYGQTRGIPVRFMDLPQCIQLAIQAAPQSAPPETSPETPPLALDPLAWIAETTGYSDPERFWEHLVEQRANRTDLFPAILELMTALRAEDTPPRPLAFNAEREAAMRQNIRAALAEGYAKIAVVCGAWHAPTLVEMPSAASDAKLLKGLPKTSVACAWVPWSYGRLAWASGYGAGIESPGWYDLLWQAGEQGLSPSQITVRWMTLVAHLLRGEDLSASSAHVIEAVRLAETLAALRERPLPGLPEMNEAIRAVFCFGDDLPLRLIHEKLIVGERLGQVPDDAPMTPLQADLTRQQKRLRLPPDTLRELDLDLRNPTDLERSILLHRLNLMNIPWGKPQRASSKRGTFHELWRVQWQPELAVQVVEASLWGNTVADAAEAFVQHTAQTADLPALTHLIHRALFADLPEAIATLMARLQAESALAHDPTQLMDAFPALAEVLRYGNVRQTDTALVQQVVDGLVIRLCLGLPSACASLNDDVAAEMFKRVVQVHHALTLLQNAEHLQAWQTALHQLASRDGYHGLLAGRACALLFDQGVFSPEEVSRRLGLALAPVADPAQAAAWVEGLLKDNGHLLIHQDVFWQIMDAWVVSLSGETFTPLLPLLRRTFSTFTAPERRALGERARQGVGTRAGTVPPRGSDTNPTFDVARAEAVLPRVAQLLGVNFPKETNG